MIYGVGTDIVRVDRMRRAFVRFGDSFAGRILTSDELVHFADEPRKAHFLAKRFAVKEACAKAMGTGFGDGLSLRHIGLAHDGAGRPQLRFHGQAQVIVERERIGAAHVSVSDEAEYALAFVILMRA
ncbi:MAG: holo-ACP synthase [Acidiferrobacteraceae bacterium]